MVYVEAKDFLFFKCYFQEQDRDTYALPKLGFKLLTIYKICYDYRQEGILDQKILSTLLLLVKPKLHKLIGYINRLVILFECDNNFHLTTFIKTRNDKANSQYCTIIKSTFVQSTSFIQYITENCVFHDLCDADRA